MINVFFFLFKFSFKFMQIYLYFWDSLIWKFLNYFILNYFKIILIILKISIFLTYVY